MYVKKRIYDNASEIHYLGEVGGGGKGRLPPSLQMTPSAFYYFESVKCNKNTVKKHQEKEGG